MPYDNTQRQALNEAKANIARALTDAGIPSMSWDTAATLLERAKKVFAPPVPGEYAIDYFNRVSGLQPRAKSVATGQRVPARTHEPLRSRPWAPPKHPRAAEIDALPRQISMGGIGNNGGLGGREARD
jgi:hypothetical protein